MGRDLNLVHDEYLKVNGVDVRSYALTSGSGVYTDKIKVAYQNGFSSLLVISEGGSDDVDISFQVSLDGEHWYTPSTTNGTTLTPVGAIVTALNQTSWIILSARLARWVRFYLDPDANSTITAKYIHQE